MKVTPSRGGAVVWGAASLLGLLTCVLVPALGEAKASKPTGTLTIQVKGLPAGSSADVVVEGKGYRKMVTKPGRTTLNKLRLGRYSVRAKAVSVPRGKATPTKASQSVSLSKKKPRGTATVRYRTTPDPADPLIASTISAGSSHTCAIRQSGQAVCWGRNGSGELGNGTEISSKVPVNVQGLGDAKEISAGGNHTCAIRRSGQGICWGSNFDGQLGNGTDSYSQVPVNVQGLGDAKEISAGGEHTCAIRQSGQAICWGTNFDGELGNGSNTEFSRVPVNVQSLNDIRKISANFSHTCAIRQSGQAVCWGTNFYGQLGNGSNIEISRVPVNVQGLGDAVDISAGFDHTCAIRQSGQAICWGLNEVGQLGNGSNADRRVPVNVQGLGDAKEVSAGTFHTCAIRQSGQGICWGGNSTGELGDGTDTASDVPVNVQGLGDAIVISASVEFTCAIRESGQAVCWGLNEDGQLGNGTLTKSYVPVNVRSR